MHLCETILLHSALHPTSWGGQTPTLYFCNIVFHRPSETRSGYFYKKPHFGLVTRRNLHQENQTRAVHKHSKRMLRISANASISNINNPSVNTQTDAFGARDPDISRALGTQAKHRHRENVPVWCTAAKFSFIFSHFKTPHNTPTHKEDISRCVKAERWLINEERISEDSAVGQRS